MKLLIIRTRVHLSPPETKLTRPLIDIAIKYNSQGCIDQYTLHIGVDYMREIVSLADPIKFRPFLRLTRYNSKLLHK